MFTPRRHKTGGIWNGCVTIWLMLYRVRAGPAAVTSRECRAQQAVDLLLSIAQQ